jgi:hypothetical protein
LFGGTLMPLLLRSLLPTIRSGSQEAFEFSGSAGSVLILILIGLVNLTLTG